MVKAIKSLYGALKRIFSAKKAGKPVFVSREVADARLHTCSHTGCLAFNPILRKCNDCNCFVDYKTLLATESCPRGRWKS
jgi:hypothetical protein